MVFGVCKRVLGNGPDAEDAFQATFLVLVRKANAVGSPDLLGNWLYGVAHRTALKARCRAARRRTIEQQVPDMPQPSIEPKEATNDVGPLLDQALSRLPDKYRVPVVLCDLEGRSRTEAAQLLRIPEGTLSSRLATARRMLAEKLSRHGVTLSGGALAILLTEQASAAMPASLVDSTVQAATQLAAGSAVAGEAVALSEEVLQAMFWSKIKVAAAMFVSFGILAGGVGYVTVQAFADKPAKDAAPAEPAKKNESPANPVKKPAPAEEAAKNEKKPQAPSVQGVVTAIDVGKNTITVRVPLNDGTKQTKEETFTIGQGVKVLLADTVNKTDPLPEGKLADLSEGTGVNVQFDADKKNVVTVTARGPALVAEVKSFDAASSTLTVVTKDKQGQTEKSLTLIPNIKVLMNEGLKKGDPDKEGKLDDLKEGVFVSVQLSVDQKKALGIRLQPRTLSGTLVGHDVGNKTITISSKGDGDRTFTVANDATLVDLVVGARVTLRFSVSDRDKVIQAQGQKE